MEKLLIVRGVRGKPLRQSACPDKNIMKGGTAELKCTPKRWTKPPSTLHFAQTNVICVRIQPSERFSSP